MGGSNGPRAPAGGASDDPWAVAERRSRAVEEPLDVLLLFRAPFPLLEVRNPLHRTHYRVMLPAFPERSVALCTCSDFARRGLGTCKHIEASARWLERHPNAPPAGPGPTLDPEGVWGEIDRRVQLPPAPAVPDSRAWRASGATLYEWAGAPYWVDEERKEEVGRGGKGRSKPSPSRGRP
jgi:hypothetical protein